MRKGFIHFNLVLTYGVKVLCRRMTVGYGGCIAVEMRRLFGRAHYHEKTCLCAVWVDNVLAFCQMMYPEKNGIWALETRDKYKSQDYCIWSADKWQCPGCGHEVLSGYGDRPTRPGEDDYPEKLQNIEVTFY